MKFSDLLDRQVVNMSDGKELGRVEDVNLDEQLRVISLLVSMPFEELVCYLPWVYNRQSIEIPVENIVNLGKDVVLVRSLE